MAKIVNMASGQTFQTVNSISSVKREKGMNLTDPLTIKKVETLWNQELKSAGKGEWK